MLLLQVRLKSRIDTNRLSQVIELGMGTHRVTEHRLVC
jgi:hypothetical protein